MHHSVQINMVDCQMAVYGKLKTWTENFPVLKTLNRSSRKASGGFKTNKMKKPSTENL